MQLNAITVLAEQGTLPTPASPLGYTVAEVAAILGKHTNTIYDWIKADILTARRLGGQLYVPRRAVADLLDDQEWSA